ncbi:MAG TPA: tyrosine-type recombinase/integrase [Acidimicrobiales bacterium]|nr:tyrosine-type recombinase/integrase [Acidimicrobiales bacterium]
MAGRRMNGEGGLYQRADGRWFGAVVLGYDESGRPRRKTVSARTKEEARRKLRELHRALDEGQALVTKEETVAQLLERWDRDVLSMRVRPLARTPLDPRNVQRDFQTICTRAGIGKWHPHELRHSAASLMLAAGVPIQVVSDVLGHSSIRMTADVYGHILQPQREEAAAALARVLFG